jgi:hypothetical protein
MHHFRDKIILAIIVIIAFCFRFVGINWDSGFHLHPDERFLTMVGIDLKIPKSFAEYLDPNSSTLNPTNIVDANGNKKYPFFVYGVFPITLNKALAILTDNDSYAGFTLTGRAFSAFMDILVVLLIYKIVFIFEQQYSLNKNVKFWAAFFYAIAVLPIQLSHFFAVDTFLNIFLFCAFYFSIQYYFNKQKSNLLFSGLFMGLAFASKITAVFMLPLILYCIIAPHFNYLLKNKQKAVMVFVSPLIFLIIVYCFLRLADPYLFEHSSFINPVINKLYFQNLSALKSWENVSYPPAVQWVHKLPIIFSLTNLAVFGVGIPYFFFIVAGIIIILLRFRKPLFIILLFWAFVFFLFQSTQFVKTMRYFIFLYPFLAIFAGIGFSIISNGKNKIVILILLLIVLIWPLSFISIYLNHHSRVTASDWIYKNIPNGSILLSEYWDDGLPLQTTNANGKSYTGQQLHVFDPDTNEKWQIMNDQLNKADYYILSSNRGWGSIPTVPEYYHQMTKFYQDLFAGKTSYKKIAEFTSYPSLNYLGIPLIFPDDWSEEAFTVYDHPKILIFQNIKNGRLNK